MRNLRAFIILSAAMLGGLSAALGLGYGPAARALPAYQAALLVLAGLLVLALILGGAVYARVQGLFERSGRYVRLIASGDVSKEFAEGEEASLGSLGESLRYLSARMERELSSLAGEKEKLEQILRNMTDGVIVCDAGLNVTVTNRASEQLLGAGAGSVGRALASATASDVVALAKKTVDTGAPTTAEVEGGGSGGEGRHLRLQSAPILDDSSEVKGVLLLFRDVTEARRVDQMRRDFVANASHELKTPVANIQLISETLAGELSAGSGGRASDERLLELVTRLNSESKRLSRLAGDLLDLSLAEEVSVGDEKHRADLSVAVKSVVSGLAAPAREAGVTVTTSLPEPLVVAIDSRQLHIVLFNLLENGIKYNRRGGAAGVEGRRADDGTVVISVWDDGIGIARGELPNIFQRFYRVDKARSYQAGGTGLGLSIVRNIVERNGGKIEAESALGKGSRFTVILQGA